MLPSSIRSVHPATKNIVPIGSSHGMSGGGANEPSWVYGYFDVISRGQATWSLTQAEWKPSASACWAKSISPVRVPWRPRCGRWMPQSIGPSCPPSRLTLISHDSQRTHRSGEEDRVVQPSRPPRPPRRRSRHPARRTRRAVGAASVAGFGAIAGAVAIGTGATASTTTPTTATTETTTPATPDDQPGPRWQRDDRSGGPVAGSSGSSRPDAASHGS